MKLRSKHATTVYYGKTTARRILSPRRYTTGRLERRNRNEQNKNRRRQGWMVKQGIGLFRNHLIPTHVWHLERVGQLEPDHLAGQYAQPCVSPILVGDVEQELEAKADAKKRRVAVNGTAQHSYQFVRFYLAIASRNAPTPCSTTWSARSICSASPATIAARPTCSNAFCTLQVTHLVIDDRYHVAPTRWKESIFMEPLPARELDRERMAALVRPQGLGLSREIRHAEGGLGFTSLDGRYF